ncbi:MAG: hypothetical protein IRZ13_03805 [Acetobacteraceae bacterium]|jgi:hypothetical protein|nr:hypothetical protein [Acetobacteraceae bacterium]
MHVIAALVAPGAGGRTWRRLAAQQPKGIIAERIVEPPVFGRLPLLVALAVPDTAAAGTLAAEEVRDRIARWAAAEDGGAAMALPMRMPLRRVARRERAPDRLRAW